MSFSRQAFIKLGISSTDYHITSVGKVTVLRMVTLIWLEV
jgi:hypothetical protein